MVKESSSRFIYKSRLALALMFMLCLCVSGPHKTVRRFFALDTVIDITIYSNAPGVGRDLDSLQNLVMALDTQLSISQPQSSVYRVNHRGDSLQTITGPLKTLLRVCRDEWKLSGGIFDITVEPLKYLYGLESHQKTHHIPTQHELDSVRALIGFDRIHFINDSTIVLPQGTHIDLGGIAKGYVLKMAEQFLAQRGYKSFLINTGGDLIVGGTKPKGEPWRIGIQDPRNEQSLIAQLRVAGTSVFTSGDYERFFIENNTRYHHLFDPKTGLPGLLNRSATVVGDDPLAIDPAVKVAFLMHADSAIVYLGMRKMLGFIVDSSGGIWASKGIKPLLSLTDSSVVVNFR